MERCVEASRRHTPPATQRSSISTFPAEVAMSSPRACRRASASTRVHTMWWRFGRLGWFGREVDRF